MTGYFIADKESGFYHTDTFTKIIQYVQSHPQKITMKERETRNGLRLLLTFKGITSVDKALKALRPILE